MEAAYNSGVNFFDCAEAYAGGESEKVMGEAIKKFGWKRNDLVISTKVSLQSDNNSFESLFNLITWIKLSTMLKSVSEKTVADVDILILDLLGFCIRQ